MVTLEHMLIILLLLVGLLHAKPKIPKRAWWAIACAQILPRAIAEIAFPTVAADQRREPRTVGKARSCTCLRNVHAEEGCERDI